MSGDWDLIRSLIRDIPDFPKPGVVFKDITPLLADPVALSTAVDAIVVSFGRGTIDKVVGIEARGFIIAAPVGPVGILCIQRTLSKGMPMGLAANRRRMVVGSKLHVWEFRNQPDQDLVVSGFDVILAPRRQGPAHIGV